VKRSKLHFLLRGLGPVGVGLSLVLVLGLGWSTGRPNAIQVENGRPGARDWFRKMAPEATIEGYASQLSLAPGDTLALHVSTKPANSYRVEIYRLGWYHGAGARRLACLPFCGGGKEGHPRSVPAADRNGEVTANWPVTDSLTIPDSWVSGTYEAELVLTSGPNRGDAYYSPFVVRAPPSRNAKILLQVPVNTWEAYNDWGGKSLYHGANERYELRAYKVSFVRPFSHNFFEIQSPLYWTYPFVRFLERQGYDVSYTTDVDTDREPAELLRHQLLIASGHSEYWSKTMRDAFEAALRAGRNLMFMGADVLDWQIRYEDDRKTVVEYRTAELDPEPNPALKTVRFRDLEPPWPECTLVGNQFDHFVPNASHDYSVDASALHDPWFAGTGLTASTRLKGLVGYEWDGIEPGCLWQPHTVFFHYAGSGGQPDADAVRYEAPSGAHVFSSGSLQFVWGLDDFLKKHRVVPGLQRFMRNALDDLTRPVQVRPVAAGLSPGIVNFGKVAVGATTPPTAITVTNGGTLPMTINGIASVGVNAGDFLVAAKGCSHRRISPGGSCTVTVAARPAAVGSRRAEVRVSDNAFGSPQRVSLMVRGADNVPAVALVPRSVDFGKVKVGQQSPARTITLRNDGRAPLKVIVRGREGEYAKDFVFVGGNCETASVPPGGTCIITLAAKPRARGERRAVIHLSDNAPDSPQYIKVRVIGS
jgi:hypothetical protein